LDGSNLDIKENTIEELVGDRLPFWYKNPVAFVREVIGVEPDVWQKLLLTYVARHDRVTCRSGHGVGKSAAISWLIIWFLFTRYPAKVIVTAPKADQLKDVIWSEVAIWRRRLPNILMDSLMIQSDSIYISGLQKENFASARTARKDVPEGLQGHHSKNQLSIAEEASGVPESIFEVIEGTMTTKGSKLVLIGNPTRTKGYFYNSFHKDRARWKKIKVSALKAKMVSEEWLDYMRTKTGERGNVWRVRVLGEFPTEDERSVIPLWLAEEARYRDVTNNDLYQIVWGLDVARYGDDRSALAKRQGDRQLEKIKVWSGYSVTQVAQAVFEEYEITKTTTPKLLPITINVDIIGLGAGVYDILNEWGLPVSSINVSESASNNIHYQRKRDELWFAMRTWFETQRVSLIIDDEDLVDELTSLWYEVLERGIRKVESKKDLKNRGYRSPDIADAFMLTFASGHDKLYKEIIRENIPEPHGSKDSYRKLKGSSQSWMTI